MQNPFNSERLQIARIYNKLNIDELSERTHISSKKLSDFENGLKAPTHNEVALMHWILEFPISFFYQKCKIDFDNSGPTFACDIKIEPKQQSFEQTELF
ncbi:helix-turn-helix domain-containing protein [Apilactobacillus sp. TMW 2.2459]|uniref:helix-turn-helix domain-containing protein n=1 Tax=Apilactobacillus xinyiensis TaxID=2841032 RepID=UPI00200FDA03|nr:helix-turn-helix transcriptional regulator [Apilactobacillus xinyiensis]MCL0312818.1 helix-turn-helix domain-containing protein [Apilactobacillus xinyiensis]